MLKEISGLLDASGLRMGVVVSRFNRLITQKLLDGAIDTFRRCGGQEENLTIVHVPGSFEIPMTAAKLAKSGSLDAIVCLGCLIRGETPHFEYLSREVTRGIDEVALRSGVPVTYGIITTDNSEQALARCGIKHGNKGSEAASAAIEMASLFAMLGDQ